MLRARPLPLLTLAFAAGCNRTPPVEYSDGACIVAGQRVGLAEVERLLLAATDRAAELQRWFVAVTIVIVVLAVASHGDKLSFLFTRGDTPHRGIGERVKATLERHRAHPVRYFTLVAATLGLLVMAAGLYVYLDADKRQNDRALTQLQFCHLALRSEAEQTTLAEQRHNLDAIAQTAGDIRALVDRLPPAEQEKAKEIVGKINVALAKQGQLVGDFIARSSQEAEANRKADELLHRDVSAIEAGLKTLPMAIGELRDASKRIDQKIAALDAKASALDQKLVAIDQKLGVVDHKLSAPPPKPAATDLGTAK